MGSCLTAGGTQRYAALHHVCGWPTTALHMHARACGKSQK